MNSVLLYFKILRPHQWTKNFFVLAGILFSENWNSTSSLKTALIAFFGFCFVSSAVYIFNDLIDKNKDKLHPLKSNRPIASGKINIKVSISLMVLCTLIGNALGFIMSTKLGLVLFSYLLLNIAYSLYLKHQAIIDLFCIALGFLFRVLAGSWAIGIHPSPWILLCTFMLSLFLGANKRYSELISWNSDNRQVLHAYSLDFLKAMIILCGSTSLITYSLYTLSPHTISVHGGIGLLYTVPIVAYGLLRYMYLVFDKKVGEDLAKDLFKDRALLISIFSYLVLVAIIMKYQ